MRGIAILFVTLLASAASFALGHAGTAPLTPAVPTSRGNAATPTTHTVEMVLADGRYRFQPEEIEARNGDRIRFVLVSGAPHNIAFDPERVPEAAAAALSRGLPDRISPLAGPLLTAEGADYTITLEGVPAGRYPFFCMPHVGMDMTGTLVVAP